MFCLFFIFQIKMFLRSWPNKRDLHHDRYNRREESSRMAAVEESRSNREFGWPQKSSYRSYWWFVWQREYGDHIMTYCVNKVIPWSVESTRKNIERKVLYSVRHFCSTPEFNGIRTHWFSERFINYKHNVLNGFPWKLILMAKELRDTGLMQFRC